LTESLSEELELRKKQYAYYREVLLSFDEKSPSVIKEMTKRLCPNGIEYKTLGEVILSLNTGLNPRQFFQLNTSDANNYYITIREIQHGFIIPTPKTDKINDEALQLCNRRSNLEKGDVLFSGTGTIGETAVVCETPTDWNIKEGIYSIKPNQTYLNPSFLRYLLTSQNIRDAYMKKAQGGTVKSIPMKELKLLKIPLPPLEVQGKIVEILDQFHMLTTSLTEGIPAEIEARRKQYHYYRNKLLTFKALAPSPKE
ncbi:MAG: restriction endonuclease subunit S, partial [Acetobacter sp.]|nr:restriction endonuclease subunit S [Acetobacter sp.]